MGEGAMAMPAGRARRGMESRLAPPRLTRGGSMLVGVLVGVLVWVLVRGQPSGEPVYWH